MQYMKNKRRVSGAVFVCGFGLWNIGDIACCAV